MSACHLCLITISNHSCVNVIAVNVMQDDLSGKYICALICAS